MFGLLRLLRKCLPLCNREVLDLEKHSKESDSYETNQTNTKAQAGETCFAQGSVSLHLY